MRKLPLINRLTSIMMSLYIVVMGALPALALPSTSPKVFAGESESIWQDTATPAEANANDNDSVELGVKFRVAVGGTITGVRFYKGPTNTGTHIGHLWSSSGTKLAQVTFSGETASGWQNAMFATPIAVTANTTYVASYLAPVGQYAVDSTQAPADPGNLSTAKTSAGGNITALASGTSGGNGVYAYTTAANGTFPTSTYMNSNYWVDVLFVPGGTAPPPPVATTIYDSGFVPTEENVNDPNGVNLGVQFQSQTSGFIQGVRFYKGATNTGTHIGSLWTAQHTLLAQATFTNETSTGWQEVLFNDPVPIDANTTYTASYFAPNGNYAHTANGLANGITNAPLVALPGTTVSGGNGVYSYGIAPQVPMAATTGSDYAVDVRFSPTYSAPVVPQPTPRVGTAGTGNVLVLTDPVNHFSDSYCLAILQTKGVACAATDTGNLTSSSTLTPYKTVILADGAPLTASQVSIMTTWINNGGNFIAMRPASNLNSLLGLDSRANILADAYLKIDNTQAPGQGIDGQTLQYHGVADQHALLAGTRAVATLYSTSNTATAYPAITTKTIGSGTASAWMFDLAKSVVYTREGNPGLAGQAPASGAFDGNPRIGDRFALGYLDITKTAVPQADLQVNLLTNQVQTTKYPVPIKWVFPSYKPNANHPGGFLKAAFILTGDDHASSSQTLNRFAAETTASPAGCSVIAWTCIRSTSYAYAGAFSDASAKPYTDAGFEVSPHIASGTQCASNWTNQTQLTSIFGTAITAWQNSYPTINGAHPPTTQRLHCYGVWKDYATIAKEEQARGMLADTNSSCWPASLFNVAQCVFTGSGFPQRIADADGTLTNVNQFATQATDENPGTTTQAALNTLITNATGSNGYYGYFTVLAHLDNQTEGNQAEAATLSVATANDIPVISAAQAQTFWAARSATTVSSPVYSSSTVTFSVTNPAPNLLLMQPTTYGTKNLSNIKVGGVIVPSTTQTINGISYAIFPVATAASYVATYN